MSDAPMTPAQVVLDILDNDDAYCRKQHAFVRRAVVAGIDHGRIRALSVRDLDSKAQAITDPAARAAFVSWHLQRVENWIQTPTGDEN